MAWAANFDDFRLSMSSLGGNGAANAFAGSKQKNFEDEEGAATNIASLFPGLNGVRVIGVIIAKTDQRHFPSKKDASVERYVISFTLRDSPNDFINVSCWGGEEYIRLLATEIHVGHVVDVINAWVQSKPGDCSEDRFRPWTPGMCQLSVNESRGFIRPYTEWNARDFLQLLHFPVKPSNDYYTISDVLANSTTISGEIISIMAVVKRVGPIRDMKSKTGRQLHKCEVKLFDDSSPDFTLILWDEELIDLAQTWDPKDTVIFAADVKTTYDEYRKSMVATAVAKTIITVNPNTNEAHSLYQFAQSVNLQDIDCPDDNVTDNISASVDISQITKIYKVSEIADEMNCSSLTSEEGAQSLGITFSVLTALDIDGSSSTCVTFRCAKCRQRLPSACAGCSNQNCSATVLRTGFSMANPLVEVNYDIRVGMSDHTGTVSNCILAGSVAEKMLQFTAAEFMNLPEAKKTEVKWKFLLERCKIYFQLTCPMPVPGKPRHPVVRIVDCSLADGDEYIRYI